MESPDSTITVEKKSSGKLRRSVASAKGTTPPNDLHENLDMQAFHERFDPENTLLSDGCQSDSDTLDSQSKNNSSDRRDARRRRQRKVHLVKRIKRKHGFKILTVTLLVVFLWLLWISA